jgi:ribosomal protein S18 acetylase RimI-like enzyme
MAHGERPTVAPATAEDIDDVTDMWVSLAAGQRRHGSTLSAEANRGNVREWVARSVVVGELLVARERDGDPVGFVGFSIDREGYERDVVRGTVSNLFVVPSRRNEGIGANLLDAAERALAAAGAERVALETLADNERARDFYTERGYDHHRVELTKPVSEAVADESDDEPTSDGD